MAINGADEKSIKQLVKHGFFTFGEQRWDRIYREQLDTAMDWAERRILSDLKLNFEDGNRNLAEVFGRIAYEEAEVKLLSGFFVTENRLAGEFLFKKGDRGKALYFVGSGTVVVVLKVPNQKERAYASTRPVLFSERCLENFRSLHLLCILTLFASWLSA